MVGPLSISLISEADRSALSLVTIIEYSEEFTGKCQVGCPGLYALGLPFMTRNLMNFIGRINDSYRRGPCRYISFVLAEVKLSWKDEK